MNKGTVKWFNAQKVLVLLLMMKQMKMYSYISQVLLQMVLNL